MADEIKITLGITYVNGNLKDTVQSETISIDQATKGFHAPVVSVGTSEEDLSLGDLATTTANILYMKNLDAANYVKIGPKSGGSMVEFMRVLAGEAACFRLGASVTLRWAADTAACKVLVKAYEY